MAKKKAESPEKTIRFIVTPALSAGRESEFDVDKCDLYIALDGRGDMTSPIEASDTSKTSLMAKVHQRVDISTKAHLILAGYSLTTPGNTRAACGIYVTGLEIAHKLGARRVTLLTSHEQFSGNFETLASVIRCRTQVFLNTAKDTSIEEVELLCRRSDVAAITKGLKGSNQLCATCFRTNPCPND